MNSSSPETIFVGDSEMARLMRARFACAEGNADWSQTLLGSVSEWSQSLKSNAEADDFTSAVQATGSDLGSLSSELDTSTSKLKTSSSELNPSTSELDVSSSELNPSTSKLKTSSSELDGSRSQHERSLFTSHPPTSLLPCVVLEVRDTGMGIPAKELPHIFEQFHRVKGAKGRSCEGSGVGLALSPEVGNGKWGVEKALVALIHCRGSHGNT